MPLSLGCESVTRRGLITKGCREGRSAAVALPIRRMRRQDLTVSLCFSLQSGVNTTDDE